MRNYKKFNAENCPRYFTTCEECGIEIKWLDSDYDGGSVEDDKFSSVGDKLKWHKKNDKSCIRERKLKQLDI